MTLHDFLSLITDEEARIELEIDLEDEEEYTYQSFWYSDYRVNDSIVKEYRDFTVTGYNFTSLSTKHVDITIEIKKQ